jgi:hypothetical protein
MDLSGPGLSQMDGEMKKEGYPFLPHFFHLRELGKTAASEKRRAGWRMTPKNWVFRKEGDQNKASLPFHSHSNKDRYRRRYGTTDQREALEHV